VLGHPGDAIFSTGIVGAAPRHFPCDPGGRYVMFLDGTVLAKNAR
jgi:hypothetical protein